MTPTPSTSESVQFSLKGLAWIVAGVALIAGLMAPVLRTLPESAQLQMLLLGANAFVVMLSTIYLSGWRWRRLVRISGARLIDVRSPEALRADSYGTRSGMFGAIASIVVAMCLFDSTALADKRDFNPPWIALHGFAAVWSAIAAATWIRWKTQRFRATEIDMREHGVIGPDARFHPWSSVRRYYFSSTSADTLVVVIDGDILTAQVDPLRIEEIVSLFRERGVAAGGVGEL